MYYKTTDANVVEAVKEYKDNYNNLIKQGEEWAKQFNSTPLFYYREGGTYLITGEVRVNDYYGSYYGKCRSDRDLWVKPNSANHSHPKSLRGKNKNNKELIDLNEKFSSTLPKVTRVTAENIYKAIDTSKNEMHDMADFSVKDGKLCYGHSLNFKAIGNTVYISTSKRLNLTEIFGSEYISATKFNV